MKIIIGLLVISFIVVIHELGHFLLAKRAGIRVEEFCVGLGPRLFGIRRGETLYSLKLFPIGGACIMTGEDGEEPKTADEAETQDGSDGPELIEVEGIDGLIDAKSFNAKTVWQRFSVVAAGPIFNFILAFVISLMLIGATGVDLPKIGDVPANLPAAKAGLQAGDRITKYDGSKVVIFRDLTLKQFSNGGKPVELTYERDGKEHTATVTPEAVNGRYVLGITGTAKERVGFFGTIRYSAHEVKYWVDSVFVGLKKIFSGQVARTDVAGPVGIINMIGSSAEASVSSGVGALFSTLAFFTILISANLGVMNLLPIPALDGGRLLFLLVELVRGKRLNAKLEGYVNLAGFVLLMGLMVFMFYNDIVNLIQ